MKKLLLVASLSGMLFSAQVVAETSSCEEVELQNLYLSFSMIAAETENFDAIAKDTLNKANTLAKELGLKQFTLTSQDYSGYRNGYSTNVYEFSLSYGFTFEYDDRAMTEFTKKLKPISFSSSISKQACGI